MPTARISSLALWWLSAVASVAYGDGLSSSAESPSTQASTQRNRRLLVVYVAGRDAISQRRVAGVQNVWNSMQVNIMATCPWARVAGRTVLAMYN